MKYLWIVGLLVVASCAKERNLAVCCTTDAECQALGIPPAGCADGFVCRHLICEPADCQVSADCPIEAPLCELQDKTCNGCTKSADCDGYPEAPVCDEATGGCRPCHLDAECPSNVCDVDAGTCVDEADVIYASATALESDPCTLQRPCSLGRALELTRGLASDSIIRMLPGTYTGKHAIDRPTASKLTIVGTGATYIGRTRHPSEAEPYDVLWVASGDVTIRGLVIDLVLGDLRCEGGSSLHPKLRLRDVQISNLASRYTTRVNECSLALRQVSIFGYFYAFAVGNGGRLDADRISVMTPNTSPAGGFTFAVNGSRIDVLITNSVLDGIEMGPYFEDSASRIRLAHNTFVARPYSGGALNCTFIRNGSARIENNIFFGGRSTSAIYVADECQVFERNVVFPAPFEPVSSTNLAVDPLFVDSANRDFSLRADSPAFDAAMSSVELATDHDFFGRPRPQGAGPDIGAIERQP